MALKQLVAAPHRGMFLAGVVQALAGMALWAFDLGGRHAGLWPAAQWPLPAPWLHGLFLLYGTFAFFVFGFILTAGPRWQGHPDTPRSVYAPAVSLLAGGWALADLGLFVPALLPVGLILALAGWAVAARFLWRVVAASADERRHIALAATASTLGACGLAAFALHAASGVSQFAALAVAIGLWGFLLPTFVVVMHRMLPFFSSGVIRGYVVHRPYWALWTLLGASVAHGALSFFGAAQWTWLVDLPAAVAAITLTRLWRLRDSFAATILAVLHVGFAWCGVAFALSAAGSLSLLAGGGGLGLAPLHALTLGFFSSTVIGMGTRVTLGHSGKPVSGDGVMWGAFWTVQLAALLRIVGEFALLPGAANLSFLASLLWFGALGVWAAKYAPNLWRPRADGRPG